MDATLTTDTDNPPRTDRLAAAWAGIIGPVLFTATFVGLEVVRGSGYDRMAETVSALEAGPHGWVQQVNFVVFGALTLVFAAGLHRAVGPTRRGLAGPALVALSGVGLLLAAAFPVREDAAGATYAPTGHLVAGVMFFGTSSVALVVLSRRLAADPRWAGLARYAAVAGVLAIVAFVLSGAMVMPDDAPLHEYAGLVQRSMILLIVFPCRVALSVRMLRLAGPYQPSASTSSSRS
jgi:hypothetical membrane protein